MVINLGSLKVLIFFLDKPLEYSCKLLPENPDEFKAKTFPSLYTIAKRSPPSPHWCCEVTDKTLEAAMAASIAFPEFFKTARAALVA